jgi:hypothetical protein
MEGIADQVTACYLIAFPTSTSAACNRPAGKKSHSCRTPIKIDAMQLLGGYLAKEVGHEGGRPTLKTVPVGNSFLPEGISLCAHAEIFSFHQQLMK